MHPSYPAAHPPPALLPTQFSDPGVEWLLSSQTCSLWYKALLILGDEAGWSGLRSLAQTAQSHCESGDCSQGCRQRLEREKRRDGELCGSWMMGGLANEYGHQGTVQLAPINTYSCVSKIHWHLMWPVSAILSVGYMGQLHHPYPGDRACLISEPVIKSTGVHSCSYTTLACIIDTTIPHSSPSLLFSLSPVSVYSPGNSPHSHNDFEPFEPNSSIPTSLPHLPVSTAPCTTSCMSDYSTVTSMAPHHQPMVYPPTSMMPFDHSLPFEMHPELGENLDWIHGLDSWVAELSRQ